jgi:hypothetical protein
LPRATGQNQAAAPQPQYNHNNITKRMASHVVPNSPSADDHKNITKRMTSQNPRAPVLFVQTTLSPNSPSANETPAPPKQYPIAATEQSQILTSIDTTLSTLKSSHIQKYGNQHGTEYTLHCMDATVDSMKSQLRSITSGVDDDLLDRQLYSFRYLRNNNQDDDDSSFSSEDEIQDVSFDDEEILDEDAYDKVRKLRRKCREVAGRVITVREEALEGALGVTRRSLEELLSLHGFSDEQQQEEEEEKYTVDNTRIIEPLNAALKNLTGKLQNVNAGGLNQKLESIKETIGTIDLAVEKCQRVARGEENLLSQTEKALIAASNVRERIVEEEEVGEETANDVDRNLARLLAGL